MPKRRPSFHRWHIPGSPTSTECSRLQVPPFRRQPIVLRQSYWTTPFWRRIVKPTEAPPAKLTNSTTQHVNTGVVDAVAATNNNPAARLTITVRSVPLDGNNPAHAIAASTPRIAAAAGRFLLSGSG